MRYAVITSTANPLIKEAARIRDRRDKAGGGLFLIEGPHLVEMAVGSFFAEVKEVFFTKAFASGKAGQKLFKSLGDNTAHMVEVTRQIISKLADTETPQGVVAVVSYNPVRLDEVTFRGVPLLAVCDGIKDPGNLGAVIRTADAAAADAVVVLPGTCDVLSPKTVRSTAGSLFNIPVIHSDPETLENYIARRKISLYVADVRATASVYDADFKKPAAVAFGGEAHGASRVLLKRASGLVRIPIMGRAESLNVAAAASVCLFEIVRQRLVLLDKKCAVL